LEFLEGWDGVLKPKQTKKNILEAGEGMNIFSEHTASWGGFKLPGSKLREESFSSKTKDVAIHVCLLF